MANTLLIFLAITLVRYCVNPLPIYPYLTTLPVYFFSPYFSAIFLYLIRFIYSLYFIPLYHAYISFIHSLYFTYYILFALLIVCYFYILFALYLYHFTAHQIILPLVTLYFVLHTLPPLTSCFINTG